MKADEVKTRLEKFYDGTTSVEEEQILLNYFEKESIDAELLEEKELFLQFYKEEKISTPAALEFKLNNLIDNLSEQELKEEVKLVRNRKYLWTWGVSVAASIVLLISAGLYVNTKSGSVDTQIMQKSEAVVITEIDKQKIKEAQDALMLLSSKFNKGVDQLAVVSLNLNKTNEILNKTFNGKYKDYEN